MKKIFCMLTVAALAVGTCCSCSDDKGPKGPKYLEVTGTATAITATVNSTGANGYYCTVAEVATVQGLSEAMEQTDTKSMAQFLQDSKTVHTEVKAIPFLKEGTALFGTQGGKDIKAATKYYVMAADLELDPATSKPIFKEANVKFVEFTTPAK